MVIAGHRSIPGSPELSTDGEKMNRNQEQTDSSTPDPGVLKIKMAIPGSPVGVWRLPATGLVLGSAVGCDIRLPMDLPAVALMVLPTGDGQTARIRPLVPLLKLLHDGLPWRSGSLPVGAVLECGSIRIELVNCGAELVNLPTSKLEEAIRPPTLTPEGLSQVAPQKKRGGWLKRWQRSLELREGTLLATQAKSAPLPQASSTPFPVDNRWRELDDWIISAREQAEACAMERSRLQEESLSLELLRQSLEARFLEATSTEKANAEGQSRLALAFDGIRITQETLLAEHKAGLANLENARIMLMRQASELASEREQVCSVLPPPDAPAPVVNPPSVSIAGPNTVQPLFLVAELALLEPPAIPMVPFNPAPLIAKGYAQPVEAQSLEEEALSSLINHEIEGLWRQVRQQEATNSTGPEVAVDTTPPEIQTVFNEAFLDWPQAPVIESATDNFSESEPSEFFGEALETEEDSEDFLPPPSVAQVEEFQTWCRERITTVATQALAQVGSENDASAWGFDEKSSRHAFAKRLLEQQLATAESLYPLVRMAGMRGVSLEDLLVALRVFTPHQVATIALNRGVDLVLGPWFIVDLPEVEDGELIFRVHRPGDETTRLVRMLSPEEISNPGQLAEYSQRYLACTLLDSEHLVRTLEVVDLGGIPCAVQEDPVGEPSNSWPAVGASVTVWYRLILQAAVALRDLHEAGLFHRHLHARHFLLSSTGLLRLLGHGTPGWLLPKFPPQSGSEAQQDLAHLAGIALRWWSGPADENERFLPEPLASVWSRLDRDHPNPIYSARQLAEELDRAGILLPSGAAAWQRFLGEIRDPEMERRAALDIMRRSA